MTYPILTFENVWALAGPVLSLYFIWRVNVKSQSPNRIQGIYRSSDVCVYYQVGVHFICNVLLALMQIPWIHDNLSCDVRKWVMTWCAVVAIFSHLPSLLDCFIRIHDTQFYILFHSQSPYNHLFMAVLCSWVPLILIISATGQYPQDEKNPMVCNHSPSGSFASSMVKTLVTIGVCFSQVYAIIIIIAKFRNIQNDVIRTFNKMLLARLLLISIVMFLIVVKSVASIAWAPEPWHIIESRLSYFLAIHTMGDVIAISLLPPSNPIAEKIMRIMSKITT